MRRRLNTVRGWRKEEKKKRIENSGGVGFVWVLLVKSGGEMREQGQEAVQDQEGDGGLVQVLGVRHGFARGQEKYFWTM